MKNALRNRASRTQRLNVRATDRQAKLIRMGAVTRGVSVTDFIIESACLEAEHALADKQEFVVSPQQWQEFLEALDRPPRVNAKLAQLFASTASLRPAERQ
jgi:uncharacterized protein (DUF1778 family)